MKKITLLLLLLTSTLVTGQNTVTIDGSKTWNGHVNAFNVSDGGYAFGFSYPVANLKTTVATSTVTLQPNFAIWPAENSNSN